MIMQILIYLSNRIKYNAPKRINAWGQNFYMGIRLSVGGYFYICGIIKAIAYLNAFRVLWLFILAVLFIHRLDIKVIAAAYEQLILPAAAVCESYGVLVRLIEGHFKACAVVIVADYLSGADLFVIGFCRP